MQSLFITATNTNIGKTFATKHLIKLFFDAGYKVGVYKPIETGVDKIPQDASSLLECIQKYNSDFKNLTPNDIVSYTFNLPAAPFCADINQTIEIDKIIQRYNQLKSMCNILLVEGAGGLMVPIKKDFFMIDLIKTLDTKTLLITPSYLGCINETMLSIQALKNRHIDFNWCVNLHHDKDSFDMVTKPFYDEYFDSWGYLGDLSVGDLVYYSPNE
jgi:dethiobiotin synthetase